MTRIEVLYFAAVREMAGCEGDRFSLSAPSPTVDDVRRAIEAARPALAGRLAAVRFARNEAFATLADPVADGDVVAVIPPVAGG